MNKKKILKIIGIVLLIVIVIFLIHTIRNYLIITDLQNKVSQYQNSKNYAIKSVATESNGTTIDLQYYRKDEKEALFLERNANGDVSKISVYNNGERIDMFWENKENKIAQLGSGAIMSVNIYNLTETDNKWQTILGSIMANIKSADYNGKECYVIKGFLSTYSLNFEAGETYIDKETGLFVKTIEGERTTERSYTFDNVEDNIFIEPDIGQYTLKEKE